MKEGLRLKYTIVLMIVLVSIIYMFINMIHTRPDVTSLVIYGDNIVTSNPPFIEEGGVYISFDTIKKTIDNNIFFDEITSKVIVTTWDDVVKLKVNDNVISINLEENNVTNSVKNIDDVIYIPLNVLEDLYNISISYNDELDLIVVDKKNVLEGNVLHNKVYVYSDITTNSDVIGILNEDDDIVIYYDKLKHNRWYKIKTSDNKVGYISKNSVIYDEITVEEDMVIDKEKIVMFWQYGNNLDTLGNKIDVVNVVSPTLYELRNSNGDINSKEASAYVNKSKSLGYKVWPIITNGIDNVNYSPKDTSLLMNSESARENLIKNILAIIERDNLDGINIDFENMKVEDRDLFTQFVRELAPLVRKKGKVISVDMYFVAYIDRKRVGEIVDYVVLMGYDQRGNWSNESGSISEIPWVEDNIKSLINDSKIDPNRIILGVPFYTRLWTEKVGVSKPTTNALSIKASQEYVLNNKLTTTYDEKSMQNYVEHKKGDITYKMWLEDSTSMKNRVDIINRYELGGLAGWQRGFETPQIWEAIKSKLSE